MNVNQVAAPAARMNRSRFASLLRALVLALTALLGLWAVPTSVHAQANAAYLDAVAEHFNVTPAEVAILSRWGMPVDEIPVVLMVAGSAGVSPDAVAALRRSGRPWSELATRYSLSAARLYVALPETADAGPLARVYGEFRSRPSTAWTSIEVQDNEMIWLVNLKFMSEYMRRPASDVLAAMIRAGSGAQAFDALVRGR